MLVLVMMLMLPAWVGDGLLTEFVSWQFQLGAFDEATCLSLAEEWPTPDALLNETASVSFWCLDPEDPGLRDIPSLSGLVGAHGVVGEE